ncbi:MAG: transglycosylase family protein [Propioniciclava sp.]
MGFRRFVARTTATAVATGGLMLGGMVAGSDAMAWDSSVWDRVAACESSNKWSINTGNGYYGGLQFSLSTWKAFGGQEYARYPHQATKAEQIAIARRTLAAQGPGAWPTCSKRAGLTRSNGGANSRATPLGSSSSSRTSTSSVQGPLAVDGKLGPKTTRAMQRWVGTSADGIWGRKTTRALQSKVGAKVDGIRGPQTTRKTQAKVGADVDGVWGSQTTRALQRYLNARS